MKVIAVVTQESVLSGARINLRSILTVERTWIELDVDGIKQKRSVAVGAKKVYGPIKGELFLTGNFREAALSSLRAAIGDDRTLVIGRLIGPDDDRATVTVRQRIGSDYSPRPDKSLSSVLQVAFALEVAADVYGAAAGGAGGVDAGVAEQADPLAEHLHRAAVAVVAGHVDIAVDDRVARCGLGQHAAAGDIGIRFHHDAAAGQADRGAAGADRAAFADGHVLVGDEADVAAAGIAVGSDRPLVLDVAASEECALDDALDVRGDLDVAGVLDVADHTGDIDREPAAVDRVEGDVLDRGHGHGIRPDMPGVADVAGQEGDELLGSDIALVDDVSFGGAAEQCPAGHECVVVHVHGAGDNGACVDAGIRPEINTVLVHQVNDTGRFQQPLDNRGVFAENTRQHGRLRTRLGNMDTVSGADTEAVPVDNRRARRLVDEQVETLLVEVDVAVDDARVGG